MANICVHTKTVKPVMLNKTELILPFNSVQFIGVKIEQFIVTPVKRLRNSEKTPTWKYLQHFRIFI